MRSSTRYLRGPASRRHRGRRTPPRRACRAPGPVDVAAGDLLRHDAELREHHPAEAADAELQTVEVGGGLHLLRKKPPIWVPELPHAKKIALYFARTALMNSLPSAKCHQECCWRALSPNGSGAQGERRILAEIEVDGRVGALDGAGLHRIEGLQAADEFAGRECLDLELVVSVASAVPGERLRRAENRIELTREARGRSATGRPASTALWPGRRRHLPRPPVPLLQKASSLQSGRHDRCLPAPMRRRFLQSVRTSDDLPIRSDRIFRLVRRDGLSPASSNGLMMHKVGAVAMKLALDARARETGCERDSGPGR